MFRNSSGCGRHITFPCLLKQIWNKAAISRYYGMIISSVSELLTIVQDLYFALCRAILKFGHCVNGGYDQFRCMVDTRIDEELMRLCAIGLAHTITIPRAMASVTTGRQILKGSLDLIDHTSGLPWYEVRFGSLTLIHICKL